MLPALVLKLRWAVLGTASVALVLLVSSAGAGVPGDPLKIGVANTVNALTGLSGTVGGAQLDVRNASTAASAFSLYGYLSSAAPGIGSAAVRGASNSAGLNGYGVFGSQAGLGVGVYGTSVGGSGVFGKRTSGFGTGAGVQGESASPAAAGVVGKNTAGGAGLEAVVNLGAPPLVVNSNVKVTSLNADYLDGLDSASLWKLGGNTATVPGPHFLGTTDNKALELKVNGVRALRLEPTASTPSLIGGYTGNAVTAGAVGATISGGGASGLANTVSDNQGAVGGGGFNVAGDLDGDPATAEYATVAGGRNNRAGNYATVAGGIGNAAGGDTSTIGGGGGNTTIGYDSTIAGGRNNSTGNSGTIGGGSGNTATGGGATVPGGVANEASGLLSFAAGYRAKATKIGSFVWGGYDASNITAPADNTFTVRAAGGIWLGTTSSPSIPAGRFLNTSTGGYLTTGGTWTNSSDRALKHNFRPVSSRSVLEKVARMPLSSWGYKAEKPSVRHIGPMAQDFFAAFGLGLDDKHIGTIDEGGVALAAIQGLYRKNQALERQNKALNARLARLERMVARMNGGTH
jgi:hypothetical protein